jgi:hypothetical protein
MVSDRGRGGAADVGREHKVLDKVMVNLIHRHWGNALAVGLGLLTALLIFPLAVESTNWLRNWYDDNNPVITAKLLRAEKIDQDALQLQFLITRHRDCDFIRLMGMTGNGPSDMQVATTLRREDGSEPVSYPSGVTVVSQPWRIAPIYGPRLMLWAYYDCSDRVVRSKMIDEVIK